MKLVAPALAALTLSAASLSAFALTTGDLYGEPGAAAAAERTIVVTPETKYVNVKIGSQEFAWDFDGLARPFELNKIAPQGALDHSVRVYVETSMQDGGFGD